VGAGTAPWWLHRKNPFPAAAVTRISSYAPEPENPVIQTAAVHAVRQIVADYLRRTDVTSPPGATESDGQLSGQGKVIVVKGDYGTGKTHLAMTILDQIERFRKSSAGGPDPYVIYQVAPGGTFLTLYTDLMRKVIKMDDIAGRVVELYGDIVSAAVRERPYAGELAALIEKGEADPQLVVERYGLLEGSLRRELRNRLSSVTGDAAFSQALMLLLQPSLREPVWRWLSGGPPDQVLLERGIPGPIVTDASALEALGVFALLYGQRNRRFVLVIDEMERLTLTPDRSPQASSQALKKLLEIFRAAGGLLVSIGLPDMFNELPDILGRIDAEIEPSPLSDREVSWYVRETFRRDFQQDTLEPFDDSSVRYLVYITRGVAREVMKFCYHAFGRAADSGREVTVGTLKSIARSVLPSGSVEMVRGETAEVISDEGWAAEEHYVLGSSADSRADFWISGAAAGTGCAVVLSDGALDNADVERLTARAAAIRSGSPEQDEAEARRKLILIVIGYLADDERQAVARHFDFVISYESRGYEEQLARALRSAMSQISPGPAAPDAATGPDLRTLWAETERIGRQQSSTHRLVRALADRVAAVSDASDEQLDNMKRLLERVPTPPGPRLAASGDVLPQPLREIFSRAQRSLDAYGSVRSLVNDAFEVAVSDPDGDIRHNLRYRLRASEPYSPLGVVTFLGNLLVSFQQHIRDWLDTLSPAIERLSPVQQEQLRDICDTYTALYTAVPLRQLDALPDILSADQPEPRIIRSGRSRRQQLEDALDRLGDQVYEAGRKMAAREVG
jgi:hypothetical protein